MLNQMSNKLINVLLYKIYQCDVFEMFILLFSLYRIYLYYSKLKLYYKII